MPAARKRQAQVGNPAFGRTALSLGARDPRHRRNAAAAATNVVTLPLIENMDLAPLTESEKFEEIERKYNELLEAMKRVKQMESRS